MTTTSAHPGLYRATITIWTDTDPGFWDLSTLAREAETGTGYCAPFDIYYVPSPLKDPGFPEGAIEFFALTETGTCDHCDATFDVGSGDDHCPECGTCPDHCTCPPDRSEPVPLSSDQAMAAIGQILYPHGNADAEWSSDQIEWVSEVFSRWTGNPLASPGAFTVRCRPQAWVNDYAIDVDPPGATDWVPTARYDYAIRAALDSSTDLDFLTADPAAPAWVAGWSGPFEITVLSGPDGAVQ